MYNYRYSTAQKGKFVSCRFVIFFWFPLPLIGKQKMNMNHPSGLYILLACLLACAVAIITWWYTIYNDSPESSPDNSSSRFRLTIKSERQDRVFLLRTVSISRVERLFKIPKTGLDVSFREGLIWIEISAMQPVDLKGPIEVTFFERPMGSAEVKLWSETVPKMLTFVLHQIWVPGHSSAEEVSYSVHPKGSTVFEPPDEQDQDVIPYMWLASRFMWPEDKTQMTPLLTHPAKRVTQNNETGALRLAPGGGLGGIIRGVFGRPILMVIDIQGVWPPRVARTLFAILVMPPATDVAPNVTESGRFRVDVDTKGNAVAHALGPDGRDWQAMGVSVPLTKERTTLGVQFVRPDGNHVGCHLFVCGQGASVFGKVRCFPAAYRFDENPEPSVPRREREPVSFAIGIKPPLYTAKGVEFDADHEPGLEVYEVRMYRVSPEVKLERYWDRLAAEIRDRT